MPPTVPDNPIRVVVADDSKFLCRLLARYLQAEPGFQVVGTALDGRRALQLVQELRPHVLTLDVDMPGQSGLEVLREVMRTAPTPVVMVSGISSSSADVTCQALQEGAVDFILKYQPGVDIPAETLRREIVEKVRAASRVKVVRSVTHTGVATSSIPVADSPDASHRRFLKRAASALARQSVQKSLDAVPVSVRPHEPVSKSPPALDPCRVIVIGASTGGPTALRELLAQMPAELRAAVVIVQHLPNPFSKVLATQLQQQTSLPVHEARAGDRLQSGVVFIAPGDRHLLVDSAGRILLHNGPKVCGHRPSIDVAMESIGERFGERTIGVILTGMGNDGAQGIAYIHSRGGRTFAQSPETCVIGSMPASAMELGGVDRVADLAGIGQGLRSLLQEQSESKQSESNESAPAMGLRSGITSIEKSAGCLPLSPQACAFP